MQNTSKNKAITPSDSGASVVTKEYFFSGGGEYDPITIVATSLEEATKQWEEKRKPVASASPTPLQDKNVVE